MMKGMNFHELLVKIDFFVRQRCLTSKGRPKLWLISVIGLYGLFCLVSGLIAPPILRDYLSSQITAELKAPCSVGKFSFNPFTLTATLQDLQIKYPQDDTEFLHIKSISLSPGLSSVLRFSVGLGHLTIDEPTVYVTMFQDGRSSLMQFMSPEDSSRENPSSGDFFPLIIHNLSLNNGSIKVDDKLHNITHSVESISLEVPFASTLVSDKHEVVRPTLSAVVNGNPLQLTGTTTPFTSDPQARLELSVMHLPFEELQPYIEAYTPLLMKEGTITTQIVLEFQKKNSLIEAGIGGTIYIDHLDLHDPAIGSVLKVDYGIIDIEQLLFDFRKIAIKEVVLVNPVGLLRREGSGRLNWERYIKGGSSAKNGNENTVAQGDANQNVFPQFFLHNMVVQDGKLIWQDKKLSPAAEITIYPIGMHVENGAPKPGEFGSFTFLIGDGAATAADLAIIHEALQREQKAVHGDSGGNGNSLSPETAKLAVQNATQTTEVIPAQEKADPKEQKTQSVSLGNCVVSGSLTLSPLNVNALLRIQSLPLVFGKSYFESAGFRLTKGTLAVDTSFILAVEKGNAKISSQQGEVKISDIAGEFSTDSQKIQGSIKEVTLGAPSWDQAANSVRIGQLALELPDFTITTDAKSSSLTPTASAASPGNQPANSKSSASSGKNDLRWLVDSLQIRSGQSRIVAGKSRQVPLMLTDVNVKGSGLGTVAGSSLQLEADLRFNRTGSVSFRGKGALEPVQIQGQANANKIPLRAFTPWVEQVSFFSIAQGILDSKMQFSVVEKTVAESASQQSSLEYSVSGDFSCADLVIKEKDSEIFAVQKIRGEGVRADSFAGSLDIAKIDFTSPRLAVSFFPDGMNTFSKGFDITGEKSRQAAKKIARIHDADSLDKLVSTVGQEEPEVIGDAKAAIPRVKQRSVVSGLERVTIGKVQLDSGSVRIVDSSVSRKVTLPFSNVQLVMEGISTVAVKPGIFKGTANIEDAPVSVSGSLTPLLSPLYAKIDASISNLDMVLLSPYMEKFLAYPVERGTLDVKATIETNGILVSAGNSLVLHQLVLGQKMKMPGAADIPIKTGLSLLDDGSGNVKISLPIRGKLDDLVFGSGAIIAKAFGNVFVKVIASPFSILDSIFGGSSVNEPQYIAFAAGDTSLSHDALNAINGLETLLNKKSQIRLALVGVVDENEKTAIPAAAMHRGVQQALWEALPRAERKALLPIDVVADKTKNLETYAVGLRKYYATQPVSAGLSRKNLENMSVEMMESALLGVSVTDADLENLGRQRAQAVYESLVTLDSRFASRVVVSDTVKMRESAQGAPTISRVECSVSSVAETKK